MAARRRLAVARPLLLLRLLEGADSVVEELPLGSGGGDDGGDPEVLQAGG